MPVRTRRQPPCQSDLTLRSEPPAPASHSLGACHPLTTAHMAWGTAAVLQHERGAEGGLQPPTPPAVRDPACTAKPPVQQQQQQQHAPLPPPSPPLPMPEPRGRRRSPSPGRAREAAAPAASAPAGAAAPHAPAARRGTAGRPQHDMPPAEAAAFAAAKLGLTDQLAAQLAPAAGAPRGGASAAGGAPHPLAAARDEEGRCCLHYAAGYGHEGCVELLLARVSSCGGRALCMQHLYLVCRQQPLCSHMAPARVAAPPFRGRAPAALQALERGGCLRPSDARRPPRTHPYAGRRPGRARRGRRHRAALCVRPRAGHERLSDCQGGWRARRAALAPVSSRECAAGRRVAWGCCGRGPPAFRVPTRHVPLRAAATHPQLCSRPLSPHTLPFRSCFPPTQARPRACEARNERGQRPVEAAAACRGAEARGEALNALLLACAGDAGDASVGFGAGRALCDGFSVRRSLLRAPRGSEGLRGQPPDSRPLCR